MESKAAENDGLGSYLQRADVVPIQGTFPTLG